MSRFSTYPATLLLIVLAAAPPAPLSGQGTTAQIAVSGGVATDQQGVRSNALSIAPGVSVAPSHRVSMQLGGSATRYANGVHALGAGASVVAQETLGRFVALTFTGGGNTTRLNSASIATFSAVDALPALELRAWRVALFGGVRAAAGNVSQRSRDAGIPLPGTASRTSITRSGAGPAVGGVLTLGDASRALRLSAREDRLRIDGEMQPERTIAAALAMALSRSTTLEIAGGRYDGNRLLGTPAGDFATAGVSLRIGGAQREPSLPRAAGAPQPRGTTRLSIRAPDAHRVEIAGDFNEWKPLAAVRSANGVWYADLPIPSGQYRYAFRIDGKEWRVPDGATAVDDGFGGKSAWLTVSDPGRGK